MLKTLDKVHLLKIEYKAGNKTERTPRKIGWNFASQESFCDPISAVVDLIFTAFPQYLHMFFAELLQT